METAEDRRSLQAALSLHRAGKLGEAANLYRHILRGDPDNYQVLHYLGLVEAGSGNLDQAKALIARSLNIRPPNVQFVENYATVLWQAGDYETALATCRQALNTHPNSASLCYTAAIALYRLRRFEESLAQFDRVLKLAPHHPAALNERGAVLVELARYDAALASLQQVLRLQPQYAEGHLNIGNLYARLQRDGEAIAAYENALKLKPELADAWLGLGNMLVRLKRFDEAFDAFDTALKAQPGLAAAWLGRGNALSEHKRYADAAAAFDKAAALKPDGAYAAAARLHAKARLCDWSGFDAESASLRLAIDKGVPESPFLLLAADDSAERQMRCAELFAAAEFPPSATPLWQGEKYDHQRIRVAYLSADYGEHAVFVLLGGVLAAHGRDRFETTAISFGPGQGPDMPGPLTNSFDRFLDVRGRSDRDIAGLMRELEIDIAIDLMGYTIGSRPAILAHRPAPLQVNYLGYPGTMATPCIDYIIADRFVVPDECRRFYREKIVYLPDTFQANDAQRKIAERTPSRADAGLPEDAFVFCSFNNSYKITPVMFGVWMAILRQTDDSVLWLLAESADVEDNLRREAHNRGVDPGRLSFAPRIAYADYLARYRLADLFLDTLPFNAGTTASDALWAGLPLVSCPGQAFASRMAGSLLGAVGLPELVAQSIADYEAIACRLAGDRELARAAKQKLSENRLRCPLFDTRRFTRNLEAAYDAMYRRHHAGLPPDHIVVESS